MQVKTEGNITLIKDIQTDVVLLLEKVKQQYNSYKDTNLILDISDKKDATNKDVLLFSKLSKTHTKSKKSFVLVMDENFDFNEATDKIMLVPSIQEAHDIIEMEEIERDLGF